MLDEILITKMLTADDLATLAERLRWARSFRRWPQAELASRGGVTRGVIQKIEEGKSLHPRQLERIARALDVSPALLQFGLTGCGLDRESIRVAVAWRSLPEPYRSALRDAILQMA